MTRLWFWVALACGLASVARAQVKPQYSQYMLNNYLLNPAIGGIEAYTDAKLGFRQQWTGIEGGPMSVYASVHGALGRGAHIAAPTEKAHAFGPVPARARYQKVRPHHGLGAMLVHDRAGLFSFTEANVSYAYHLLLGQRLRLSAGVGAGLMQYVRQGSGLRLANPNDQLATDLIEFRPNLGLGLWLYSHRFYLGLSGAQLLAQPSAPRHYFATLGVSVPLGPKWQAVPSVLVKQAAPMPLSADVNLRLVYAQRLWAGASYRPHNGLGLLLGMALSPLLDLSYTYDWGLNQPSRASGGTHEILIGFRLGNRFGVYCPQSLW